MSNSHRQPASPKGHLLVHQARASAEAGQWQSALVGFDEAERENPDWGLDPDFLNDRAVTAFTTTEHTRAWSCWTEPSTCSLNTATGTRRADG